MMQPIANRSTALLILNRPVTAANPMQRNAGGPVVGAGPSAKGAAAVMPGLRASQDGTHLVQMKTELYERIGEALGVKQDDFKTIKEYSNALKNAVSEIRSKPDSKLMLSDLEHKLGLDDLGVSLDEAIDSMTSSTSQKKLNAALLASEAKTGKHAGRPLTFDEAGTYAPA